MTTNNNKSYYQKFNKVFILMDCNNFFVSCERIFRPDLQKRPVVVLSNNDGCVIARSYEVKALKIKMGEPFFKIQSLIKKHHICYFSSNFDLYLDISSRVMRSLEKICDKVEIYSVDEAFLEFSNISEKEAIDLGFKIKRIIATQIGIPVGIGIAKTKTLAKLANHYAKSNREQTKGIYSVLNDTNRIRTLYQNPIIEIWGIGKRLNERLNYLGFTNAYDLSRANIDKLQKEFSITLVRTIKELNNIESIQELPDADNQAQIICSRSYTPRLTSKFEMEQAIFNHVANAALRLRKMHKYCISITVFFRTSYFIHQKQYAAQETVDNNYPTDDNKVLIEIASLILNRIWKDGFEYAKAGVILSNITKDSKYQTDIFDNNIESEDKRNKSKKVMQAMDKINEKHPNSTFYALSKDLSKNKRFNNKQHLSPCYTTNLEDLPYVL